MNMSTSTNMSVSMSMGMATKARAWPRARPQRMPPPARLGWARGPTSGAGLRQADLKLSEMQLAQREEVARYPQVVQLYSDILL